MMAEDPDRVTLNFGEENDSGTRSKTFRHPIAVGFHLCFRVLAIVTYLLCGLIGGDSFVSNFVAIVVLLSIDFWTVKNITGRLLAGLRWWNQVDEDGQSRWVFESRKGSAAQAAVQGAESRIFWLGLIGSQVLWIVFAFIALITFKLQWFMVAGVGVTLNGANLYGYVRCKMGTTQNISSAAKTFLGKQVLGTMLSSMSAKGSDPPSSTQHL